MVQKIIRDSKQMTDRQMTWILSHPDIFTHIRLMIQMMPPPLSFFFFLFFSSFSDCYCTEFFLDLRDDWMSHNALPGGQFHLE
jgi:hypothetical protein